MSRIMELQSKALTCENCQFSDRGVSTHSKQKLLEHFGTVHGGSPVQDLSSFPFLTATGLSKIKEDKEQLLRCRTSGVCHFICRSVCCKVRLCLVAAKLLAYPLPGYGALGWRHLFLKFALERPSEDQNNSGKSATRPGLLQTLHPTKVPRRVPIWVSMRGWAFSCRGSI